MILQHCTTPITWSCEICGRQRDDADIAVLTLDISEALNLPPDTARRNVRYCRDSDSCWFWATVRAHAEFMRLRIANGKGP